MTGVLSSLVGAALSSHEVNVGPRQRTSVVWRRHEDHRHIALANESAKSLGENPGWIRDGER
jgi:hypothetical protein